MIIQYFQKLWRYNEWAWGHVLGSVQKIADAELKKEHPFFWKSLHSTLAHTVGAEHIWLERLNGHSPSELMGTEDLPTVSSIIKKRTQVQINWGAYLNNLTIDKAQSQIMYQSTEGIARQNKIADIVQHVINHSTEHRSQLTPILFQLGMPTDPLDYIYYCVLHEPD